MAVMEPKFVDGERMRVAGLEGRYTREQVDQIPAQWMRFNAVMHGVPGRVGEDCFGVVYPEAVMRYLTVIALDDDAKVPSGWVEAEIPKRRYAVFAGGGNVDGMRKAWDEIFSEWLPRSGMKVQEGAMLERYDDRWMETGEFEIWIPV